MRAPATGSVSERLARAVAAGRLSADAAQLQAARRLDRLRAQLLAAHAPLARLRSGWRRMLGRSGTDTPGGLYLWGGVGRGKTLLLDHFVDSLAGAVPLERTHFYRFMREVHAGLKALAGRPDPLAALAEELAGRMQVLCLDEFLVIDIGDAMILSGLIAGLLGAGVALIATSNLAPAELYRDGLQRARFVPAIELIERRLEIVELDGGIDYRLRELEQAPIFFDAAAPGTAAAFAARFRTLAGSAARPAGTLEIEGRPIPVRALGPGLAWFDFTALCEGPRSQNDYIEIARRFGTLFLSDVPVLDETRNDAARRFIMLIDELYDRAVKLVITAMAPPEGLYRGERLAVEFTRAASRLVEMQSAHYLAGRHRP